ncbi:MAG: hypothetical protein C0617_14595 [Desulfuromonas sp.]|uniref:hypothetical protein n=1 Tax=Desulfuromonas sp. TaxID=892 RepID=UPI000CC6D66D|nr:hypothetical protein [Desulfuromonas sp.]PLX82345.1 MAG: hypothetical protein C0617_14595 [Desulfuromonas sp.]
MLMEFDIYFKPPSSQDVEKQRATLLSRRKKAAAFASLLALLWAGAIYLLWTMKFADQRTTLALGGGTVVFALLARLLGGSRAAVGAIACLLVALGGTTAATWILTTRNDLALAVYVGVGGGLLLGIACLAIGHLLRTAQEGLQALKPIPEKRKAHSRVVELCAKHPMLETYFRQVREAGRPLLKGEIAAMKKWAQKSTRAALVPEPAEDQPEPAWNERTSTAENPSVSEPVEVAEHLHGEETEPWDRERR